MLAVVCACVRVVQQTTNNQQHAQTHKPQANISACRHLNRTTRQVHLSTTNVSPLASRLADSCTFTSNAAPGHELTVNICVWVCAGVRVSECEKVKVRA